MNWRQIRQEIRFLGTLTAVNLASALEYRASFISQIVGMLLNDGVYFVFWLIFFRQFGAVRGYQVGDVYLLFAIVILGYGVGYTFAGNVGMNLAYLIAQGRLDYYLTLPRPLLLHIIFSRMSVSAIGDITFGLLAYLLTGRFQLVEIALFLVCVLLVAVVMVAFGVLTGSLAFFMGNSQFFTAQLNNAFLTFALYPNTLFSGAARVMLFTLIPAAFVGAVPVEVVRKQDGWLLLGLVGATAVISSLAISIFYLGLRRYESGSALNVNV